MAENESYGVDEFEREPIPARALLGFKSFIGMYAGEHCAGTELMIGPLFVAAGVSAFDLIVGLLLGNLLAVLSWTFLTAPIAVHARLTLYYQLEKICGRRLVTLYNLANGVMFCFLAGAMITVSATAVGVWVRFDPPELNDVAPFPLSEGVYQTLDNIGLIDAEHTRRVDTVNVGWIVSVFAVGALIAIVAAYGYVFVARVANIAAPWMVLVFLAFGLIGLKQFIDDTGSDIQSWADLWNLATTHIWKGGTPLEGQPKFTLMHVMFFAWFCNMAMHIGMSDLSVFRYARHSWYGLSTASGMYVGHFMAWISASILYALQLFRDPSDTNVLPGPLAYEACGVAGLLCVIVAGWTTANPTIYRAGLAFQAIMPRTSRFKVTLVTGLIATVAGMFPALAMKLLGFVMLYGMLLMPMGAVVLVDFYFLRKFGLESNYAELSRKSFNWAAGLTWFLTLGTCWALVQYAGVQIYFVSLPGWFVAAVLYVVLSKLYQRSVRPAAAVAG
jgi:purine-cytosine permease-like protein